MARTVTWLLKALVLATPISGPAWSRTRPSASRAMLEPATLQIASVGWPLRYDSRSAASVSAVSPDCVMATTMELRSSGELR